MTEASFDVEVMPAAAIEFAKLSGDWNPAATTAYRRPVLHGAFSAGLVSRMAGMYLPGKDCLLLLERLEIPYLGRFELRQKRGLGCETFLTHNLYLNAAGYRVTAQGLVGLLKQGIEFASSAN